jgi:translation elongation factor P/translation initiation factor 5A
MVENINTALLKAYQADLKLAETDLDHICQMQPSQYLDQMKEVRAFMHVEDYETYKSALEKGLLESLGNKHNVRTLENIIDLAVELLVP